MQIQQRQKEKQWYYTKDQEIHILVSWKTQKKQHTNVEHKKPQIDEASWKIIKSHTNRSKSMRSYTQLTRECRDPQWRQRCPQRRKCELERRKNREDLFREFHVMGLLLPCVLYFDGFVVGGQVQLIKDNSDRALKSFESILSWQLREKKKAEENENSR